MGVIPCKFNWIGLDSSWYSPLVTFVDGMSVEFISNYKFPAISFCLTVYPENILHCRVGAVQTSRSGFPRHSLEFWITNPAKLLFLFQIFSKQTQVPSNRINLVKLLRLNQFQAFHITVYLTAWLINFFQHTNFLFPFSLKKNRIKPFWRNQT